MTFTRRLRDGVRRGEITCSVRIWARPHVKVSRCWTCLIVSPPIRTGAIRSQAEWRAWRGRASPSYVRTSGAFSSACACWSDSQFPTRTPWDRTPFMRAIPDASSGASKPLSAASTASFRTAVIRTLIEIGPSPRASSATRRSAPLGRTVNQKHLPPLRN